MAAWQPELVPSTTTILPGAKDLRPEMLVVRSSQPRRKSRRGQVVGGEIFDAGGLIFNRALYHGICSSVCLTVTV